jgi:hypothetical protein
MNVATRAMSGPQASTMISKVRARVEISMPLLTKMSKGRLAGSSIARSLVNVSLGKSILVYVILNTCAKTNLTPSVGIAKRMTSVLASCCFEGRLGPTAVMPSANAWSLRQVGCLRCSLKWVTKFGSRAHKRTSWDESARCCYSSACTQAIKRR